MWDYDTIEMERQQFPSVLELLSGKFIRHSPEFYYWRIKNRRQEIKKHPEQIALYDDLAVACSKTGAHQKGIDLMFKKDSLRPGMYETYSNIGTFYIFAGKLKKALEYIDKALSVNENAHFGREIYQKYLVEYLLSKTYKGKVLLPLDAQFYAYPQDYFSKLNKNNFYGFLIKKYNQKYRKNLKELPEEELSKAIVGIMGMMKFADHNSPILLEVLGDLLFNTGNRVASRHLACRAYLKASRVVEDSGSKEVYRKRTAFLLAVQYADNHENSRKKFMDIELLEKLFDKECEQGDEFYKQIQTDELNWIKKGVDVDLAFAEKYYNSPQTAVRDFEGLLHVSEMRKKYINDTIIGKKMDYRPVFVYSGNPVDSMNIILMDSLFERNLIVEIPDDSLLNKKDSIIEIEKPEKQLNYFLVIGSGLFLLFFAGFVLTKKK